MLSNTLQDIISDVVEITFVNDTENKMKIMTEFLFGACLSLVHSHNGQNKWTSEKMRDYLLNICITKSAHS